MSRPASAEHGAVFDFAATNDKRENMPSCCGGGRDGERQLATFGSAGADGDHDALVRHERTPVEFDPHGFRILAGVGND